MHIYIHLPFCRSKCAYCAFYSETGVDTEIIDAYINRISADLARLEIESVGSVYIGGGTPTLLCGSQLEKLQNAIMRLPLLPDAEISCESNPETLDREKVALLRTFVSRISIGIQSFDPVLRRTIGRDTSCAAIEKALEKIAVNRFPHASADLIYAMPGQTVAGFASDVNRITSCGVFDHFSAYSLTPEEGTRLAAAKPQIDDETAVEMYETAAEIAGSSGFARYEISNYAASGGKCRHNCAVWRGERYVGVGAGASGFDGRDRYTNAGNIKEYLSGAAPLIDRITPEKRTLEIAAVNLRTCSGWRREDYEKINPAISWKTMLEKIAAAAKLCQLDIESGDDFVRLSAQGLMFWDSIAGELLTSDQPD